MSTTLAAIIGAAAGAFAFAALFFFLLWFCLFRDSTRSRASETASSDPSLQGKSPIPHTFFFPISSSGISEPCFVSAGRNVSLGYLSLREARRFEMEDLSLATKSFSHKSLIGVGKFGEVYKGLLQDGMLVAIKKRPGAPTQEFVSEARYLSSIHHRNLVSLLGYCQENNMQFLVYEYVPNGSVSTHLYGVGGEKLEFRHRLSISLGAAKGLAHLHSLSPRLIHKDFKTANVLVDENFIAKVADAGLLHFLGREDVGPSSRIAADEIFLAPEVQEFWRFSEKSDVYAFGVFLLELISGKEASSGSSSSDSTQTLVEWMQSKDYRSVSRIIDERLWSSFTAEGMEGLIRLTVRCLEESSERRPGISNVVTELESILEKEVSLTTIMGEGTPTVTLGSQLFKATK